MENNIEVIKANRTRSDRKRGRKIDRRRVAAYCRVSTDTEDQLNSYKSQVEYYTSLIKEKSEWAFAGIYADEGITGTQVAKREEFKRLINDCMNGEIDMVITKSISRFARNTEDTLKYVRMLKEKNVAVVFEDVNINTLDMEGELLLAVLSSVAQQEVENISANVKKGLKIKMQRGELVGFHGCLGYDYDREEKNLVINEEEAEIVRYIFRRYIEGAGGKILSRELRNLGYKTKRGGTGWPETTVINIIKNEKYKGDLLLGKTFTVDPITKRRLNNFGEEDMYYIKNHHEPIVSEEVFNAAQAILTRRSKARAEAAGLKREKFSRQYAFSCLIECGFCGASFTRRAWHCGTKYKAIIWQCVTFSKKGKKHCPECKAIKETTIEQAFVEAYRLLCAEDNNVLDEFLKRTEATLCDGSVSKRLEKLSHELERLETKKSKLVDLRLDESIDKGTFDSKVAELSARIFEIKAEQKSLKEAKQTEKNIKYRIDLFKKTLEKHKDLETFDRNVFESVIEKIIVGGYNENGEADPSKLTFIFKTGIKESVNGRLFKAPRMRKSDSEKLRSYAEIWDEELHSDGEKCTCGDGGAAFPKIGRVKTAAVPDTAG